MRKARLENWQEIQIFGRTCLVGDVYDCQVTSENEKTFQDGEEMISSAIIKYHEMMGQTVAETKSGSMYHLGKPAEKDRNLQEIFGKYASEKKDVS